MGALVLAAATAGCGGDDDGGSACGPTSGTVASVVDGDTVDLATGERVRYLMIDTPELSSDDCYAVESRDSNTDLVAGREVSIAYDVECEDMFGRLLAYVSVDQREINTLMVERGYACVLSIPPNGADRRAEFENLEAAAKAEGRGMWGACAEVTCD